MSAIERPGARRTAAFLLLLLLLAIGSGTYADDAPADRRDRIRAALETADVLNEAGRHTEARARYEALADESASANYLPELEYALRCWFGASSADHAYDDLLRCARRLVEVQIRVGAGHRAARTESDIGGVLVQLGEFEEALEHLKSAERGLLEAGEHADAAHTLVTAAIAYAQRGAWPDALAACDRSASLLKDRDADDVLAYLLAVRASLHVDLGEPDRALALHELLASGVPEGDLDAQACALHGLGVALADLGRLAEARGKLQAAHTIRMKLEDELGLSQVHLSLGELAETEGHFEDALREYTSALEHAESFPLEAAWARQGRADALLGHDPPRCEKAIQEAGKALAAGLGLDVLTLQVDAHRSLAEARLACDQVEKATADASLAMDLFDLLDVGLGDNEAAFAREQHGRVVEVALRCALAGGNRATLFRVLERSRARALAAALGGAGAVGDVGFSPDQRARERAARTAIVSAQSRHLAARADGNLDAIRETGEAWTQARRDHRSVLETIEREGRRTGVVHRVAVVTLEQMKRSLSPTDVFVAYAFVGDDVGAQVVTRNGTPRWIDLGKAEVIQAACDLLAAHWSSTSDPSKDAAHLASLVLDPLGLAPTTSTLRVSPDGPLTYVPFDYLMEISADLPRSARVVLVPSGTVHRLLTAERKRTGKRLLALGAPDYRDHAEGHAMRLYGGSLLHPLPEAEGEVKGIATRKDLVLLGRDASETRFRTALSETKRWRAVHFACHGSVNAAVPSLSGLALTPTAEDDGFLTAAEIMHLHLPADLVVLSACESGLGRTLRGEGMLGLARAFMCAGTPRVVASLWRVDDEATAALMRHFHREWKKPGFGTAEALRRAQREIRGAPGTHWHAPRYWAAWVLWGLSD